MKRYRRVDRVTIWTLASLAAVNAYRAAFKAGRLGQSHRAVVGEVYGLAADELRARARWPFRMWMVWFGLGLAFTGVTYLLDVTVGFDRMAWWVDQVQILCLVLAVLSLGKWIGYDDSARLLTPPLSPRTEPDAEVPMDTTTETEVIDDRH